MLYYNFSNFEAFKERFGIQEHANGEKSRKNKILLAFIKNKELLHEAVITGNFYLLHITDMSVLKKAIWGVMENHAASTDSTPYKVELADHVLFSSQYETDEFLGICADGDTRSVRYVNHKSNDRVFKMKAGKFLRSLILDNEFGQALPEQVVTYLCEEFSQDWQVHCQRTLPENKLYVNDEFARIYDSDAYVSDTMHSCMVDKDLHTFYRNNLADFYWIESHDEYHHKDDCVKCADTDDWELTDDAYYSDLTEEYYSELSALEDAEREYKESNWAYSEFDDEYYANEDEVVTYQRWNWRLYAYEEKTIFIGTLINLVRNEVFFAYDDGKVYNMLCHGEPLRMAA